MAASVCHVVFNQSAVAGLSEALRQAGRDEHVISLSDCLSFGPIDPPDAELRSQWVEEELGYTGWEDVVGPAASFWSEARSTGSRKIVWLSRRSTQEYAGFLEWLWRFGEEPVEAIDLTDTVVKSGGEGSNDQRLAISLALLTPHAILENDLFSRAEILTSGRQARYRQLWARLRIENAPLRILSGGELASGPLSFFDPLLLSCATAEWQKAARIIGKALSEFWTTSVLQTGDLVLCARARQLVDAGRLECRGDLNDIQRSELRLSNGVGAANTK